MRSFVKVKSSRIGEITLLFTDISKSRPCREFLTSQIYLLTPFVKIKFLRKIPNLQYSLSGKYNSYTCHVRERSGSVVECLTGGRRAMGSSLTDVTALCP